MKYLNNEIGIVCDIAKPDAVTFKKQAIKEYNFIDLNANPSDAKNLKLIIVVGGDGFLLHTVHQFLIFDIPFYGVNYGAVGFLLNDKCNLKELKTKIQNSNITKLKLLKANVETKEGASTAIAMNEVSLFRASGQIIKIKVYIDGVLRLKELAADGIVLSTSAGSTAYNFSLHGPIFVPEANVLSLCPISPFRPRHFRGALLSETSNITFEVEECTKRPAIMTADFHQFANVKKVSIALCKNKFVKMLFNEDMPLTEKILTEQFLI